MGINIPLSFRSILPFLIGLTYCVSALLLLDSGPSILYDEALYADTAYTFFTSGAVTNILGGNSGREFFFYPLIQGSFLTVLPSTLFGFRMFSVLAGLLSLVIVHHMSKRLFHSQTSQHLLLALFASSNIFFMSSRIVRPEIVVLVFILFAIWQALIYLQDDDFSAVSWMTSSLVCAALSHSTGVVFVFSFAVSAILIYPSKVFRKLAALHMLYGLIIPILMSILYFSYSAEKGFFEWFATLLFSDRVPEHGNIVSGFLQNVALFINGYSIGFKRLLIIIVEIAAISWGLLHLRKHRILGFFAILSLLNILIMFLLFQPFLRPYYLTFVASTLLCIAIASEDVRWPTLFKSVVLLYIVYSFAGNMWLLYQYRGQESSADLHRMLERYVDPNERVFFDHHYFWFWRKHEHTTYKGLQAHIDLPRPPFVLVSNSDMFRRQRSAASQSDILFQGDAGRQLDLGDAELRDEIILPSHSYGHIIIRKFDPPAK